MIYSQLSKKVLNPFEAVQGKEIRAGVFIFIQQQIADFTEESYLSLDELNYFRRQYLSSLVEEEKKEVAMIDRKVMKAIRENSILSSNIEDSLEDNLTFGQKMADNIATFGGSWTFIIAFFSFLMLWILTNVWFLATKPFDPYPFILLNLILSCLAAIQAPIIMMSQNRQEQKDRQRAEHDYQINLKAELEIKILGEKIDHLLIHQNRKLLEIQEVQIDYLDDLLKKRKSPES
jgi:uncharacterized membrane protein